MTAPSGHPSMRPSPTLPPILAAVLLSVAPAHAAAGRLAAVTLDLPVRALGSDVPAPCYRGDVLELRLASHAARSVNPRGALPSDSLALETFWLFKDQAQRTDIRAPEAWQVETGDTNIIVGVIDTGVLPYHPDLSGRDGERGQLYVNWAERGGLPGVDDDGN